MDVTELEAAMVQLDDLLRSGASEAEFQRLFETAPTILDVLGYARFLARPRLPLVDGGYLEPDFLAETSRTLWEIVDLKLPTERLLLDRDRRERFTSKLNDYIAQVHEYDEYFDDPERRAAAFEQFGVDVQRRPAKLLIAGSDEGTDKREVHHQLSRLASRVDILTYDDVYLALLQEHARLAGDTERGRGFSSYILFALDNPAGERRGYLFDFVGSQGNRLSLYLDEARRLVLELTTTEGETLVVPAEVPSHDSLSPLLLNVEVGTNEALGFLQMRIEDSLVGQLRLQRRNLQPSLAFSRATLGNNVEYSAGGWFGMFEWTLFKEVLPFNERREFVRYFLQKRTELESFVLFSGAQGMDIENLSEEPIGGA